MKQFVVLIVEKTCSIINGIMNYPVIDRMSGARLEILSATVSRYM